MEKFINFLSLFIFPIILIYGFAIIFGKTKEVNKALSRMFKSIFQFFVDIFCSILSFVFQKLREAHRYFYHRWPAVTIVIEIVILGAIILLIIK